MKIFHRKKHDDAVQWVSKPVFNKDGYVSHVYHVEELVDKWDLMDLKKRSFNKKWSDKAKNKRKQLKKNFVKSLNNYKNILIFFKIGIFLS